MHSNTDVILDMRNIRKFYKDRAVLDGISLQVRRGEAVGLWGRNASGKSTILKIAAGMAEPDNDDATIVRPQRGRVGYLAQDPMLGILPWFKAWKNVAIHSKGKLAKAGAADALEQFGFDGSKAKVDSFPLELSGGSVQRLGWTCATLDHNDLILLDEPFAEQDEGWCRSLWQVVRALVKKGRGIIVVSHEPQLLALCCDRVITIRGAPVCNLNIDIVNVEISERVSWATALGEAREYVQRLQQMLYMETFDESAEHCYT